jgi:hypothetical protein
MMEYARVEMLLVRGWTRSVQVAGAIDGPVRGVLVIPSELTVARTLLSPKRARQRASLSASAALPDGAVLLRPGVPVRGTSGVLGVLSRVWVASVTNQITHVLMRTGGLLTRGPFERIIPAELIAAIGGSGLTARVSPADVRGLPIFRADHLIAADVALALDGVLTNPRARRGVKVHVDDGHVTLAGEVDTLEQRQLAERAAASVTGVRGITVDAVAQEALAAAVEARIASLIASSSNGHGPFHVQTEHGIVYLEGSVTSEKAHKEIEQLALGAAGVRVVVNNLLVNGQPPTGSLGTGPLVRNR